MEFKFRALDGGSSAQFRSSSTTECLPEQSFRANYPNMDPRRNLELMRMREIEKEHIRNEIIAEEIARRALKAEVWRELMMEREMATRIGVMGGGLTFGERLTMNHAPRPWFTLMNQFDNRWLEEHSAFHGRGVFDPWVQSPSISGALVAPDVKPASEDNEDKLTVLAKSDPNRCGVKRKAPTPPEGGAAGLPYVGLKKKPKEEWSCALCQVSAISERGLNEHLRGKKHKARQARLRTSKMAKNPRSVCLSGNSSRSAKLANTSSDKKTDKNTNDTDKKTGNKLDSGNQNGKLRLQKNVRKKTKNKDRAAKLKRKRSKAELAKAKKFEFWCETCQVGAYSAVVMEAHKKGKKHLFRLLELDQTGEAVSTIMTIALSKTGEKAKDTEVATGKTNMKIMEDANVNEKITETVADNQKMMENAVADADHEKMKGSLIADWDGLGQSSMLIIKTD